MARHPPLANFRHPALPALVWLALVAGLLLLPQPADLGLGGAFPGADKVGHGLLFGVAAALLLRWFATLPGIRRPLLAAVGVAALYGGALEVAQGALGFRSAEVADGAANLAGAALAGVIVRRETAATAREDRPA
jgi:hypothetical protein